MIAAVGLVLSGCSAGDDTAEPRADAAIAQPSAAPAPESADDTPPAEADLAPRPFVPAGPVGTAADLDELIARLETLVPTQLQAQVPWPDLRNPDPVAAQLSIFELWVWMAAHLPEPALVEAMAAPGSPSRQEIAGIFGRRQLADELVVRRGDPYVAFDHRTVTFESAGLPLWLARDVPSDAVVVYYQDTSGPADVVDATTGETIGSMPAVGARQWLSIIVPTDVGWLLYRDQLIEPGDPEFDVPDDAGPAPGSDRRQPEV